MLIFVFLKNISILKVAIQGIKGSFHDWAAEKYFGRSHGIVACRYFSEIPEKLTSGEADKGVMAIENSLAGSILPNYILIDENGLVITGEIYIPVSHSLMALPGTTLDSLQEVWSHSMALLQCRGFFRKYPALRRVEYEDTAEAAKDIALLKKHKAAAIAPAIAADLYGLEILASDIQDHPTNTTRFVVVEPAKEISFEGNNKISMKVVLPHRKGSLFAFLSFLQDYDLNMTKIQSVPLGDRPWEYAFFIDALYEDASLMPVIWNEITGRYPESRLLGAYQNGII